MLEPYDGKLSRTVLRGEEGRKPLALPGVLEYEYTFCQFNRRRSGLLAKY